MRAVHHKVNIVPIIAKSDTLTKQECQRLKTKVWLQLSGVNIWWGWRTDYNILWRKKEGYNFLVWTFDVAGELIIIFYEEKRGATIF